MAKGFSNEKISTENTVNQEPTRVQYEGKTPSDYAKFAARKTVEERFKLADAIAREGAQDIIQDIAFLESRHVQKALADGTITNMVLGHLIEGNDAMAQSRMDAYDAIDAMFVEGGEANFTAILSAKESQLRLAAG